MASISFSAFPALDFSKLDLTKLPKLPQIDVPKIDTDAVLNAVKDAGYITVGLAVLTAQKAQVRRQELKKSLNDQVGDSRSQMAEIVDVVEARLATLDKGLVKIEAKLDDAVEGLGKRLPERAASVVGQAHEVTRVARQQVRQLLIPAS